MREMGTWRTPGPLMTVSVVPEARLLSVVQSDPAGMISSVLPVPESAKISSVAT